VGLRDADPNVRLASAEALLSSGSDPESVAVLEQLIRSPLVRSRSLQLLLEKGEPSRIAPAVRAQLPRTVEEFLRGSGQIFDPFNNMSLILALGTLRDREAVPALAVLLGGEPNINFCVVRALIEIGGEDASQVLVQGLSHASLPVRIHVAGGILALYES
jgi:hypothetical protein